MRRRDRPTVMRKIKPERRICRVVPERKTAARDDRLGRVLGYLVAITAILGIPTGLYGYYSGEHAKRVQNTFEFYKKFRDQTLQDKYQDLINRYDAIADDVDKLSSEYQNNPSERDRQVLEKIKALVDNGDGSKEISSVLLFFDELTACVKSSLCDRNTAVVLFQLPAYELASAYGSYIIYVRGRYKNKLYGTGLFQIRALKSEWSFF